MLRKIVDVAFSDSITEGLILYLKHLIQEHHALFRHLFPHTRLLPKHHFMVHYPMALKNMGPLINLWSMRFEAKHNLSKRLAGVVGCFRDFCKTAASRHQLSHCSRWSQHEQGSLRLEIGEAIQCSVADVDHYPALLNDVPGLRQTDDVFLAQKITHLGTTYGPNTIVVLHMENDLPTFGQISHSVVAGEHVFLTGCLLRAEYFDDRLHAFIVYECDEHFFVHPGRLRNFRPLH